MAKEGSKRNRHFILKGITQTEKFRSHARGGKTDIRARDRKKHGGALQHQLNQLQQVSNAAVAKQQEAGIDEEGLGICIEFRSFPGIELVFESLARENQGIELRNIRHGEVDGQKRLLATVFVPKGKLAHFQEIVKVYMEKEGAEHSRDHQKLVDSIADVRPAKFEELWTDAIENFPDSNDKPLWMEIWLPVRNNRRKVLDLFSRLAKQQGIRVANGELEFPERTVVLAYASVTKMQHSMDILNCIAEIRRAKRIAEFFESMEPDQQRIQLDELLKRTRFSPDSEKTPRVCLLDTGINRGHRLLEPAITSEDLYTIDPAWGAEDTCGHGTRMAGLALVGNLSECLSNNAPVQIKHLLESVKIIKEDSSDETEPQFYGRCTQNAVSRPEQAHQNRSRVFSLTVTAPAKRDRGKPSAWSAKLDALASDAERKRLLVVSAGSIKDMQAWADYPDSNDSDEIHDPAQAWNALTIGACTNLVHITGADTEKYKPIAAAGALSPFSATSMTWPTKSWPLKPDVVFEGGNAAKDQTGATTMSDLMLLTTHHQPADRSFTTANATSAATALAARFAAELMAEYPQFWPETIRALIVHSAEWSEAMQSRYLPQGLQLGKGKYRDLIRRCGFGIPNLDQALYSVSNSLTMIIENTLQPFIKEEGISSPSTSDMHFHKLPWPADALNQLGAENVEMRVTLSYFIEPNPSQRGKSRYRYQSHGLRFEVKKSTETREQFEKRINAAALAEGEKASKSPADLWLIGPRNRHRGSLHTDIWRGSATDLASREYIGIYPASGWWQTRPKLEGYKKQARYSLVVSIKAPEIDVDLYSEVASKIATSVPIET